MLGDVFTSEEARDQLGGPVGVGAVFNEVADDGLITILRFIGVISLALGLFNLLPILPLDGGHILFALLEKAKGRRSAARSTSGPRSSASRSSWWWRSSRSRTTSAASPARASSSTASLRA